MKNAISILLTSTLFGCATATYTLPPSPTASADEYQRTYGAPFDQVWTALVDHASSTFFGIDNFEKSSGLLTLSFGAQNPDRFINCGRVRFTTPSGDVEMPYAKYLYENLGAILTGKMNLVVRSVSESSTIVRVNTRYVFSTPATANVNAETFAFETTTQGYRHVRNPLPGTSPTRACRSTQVAERTILDGVATSLSASKQVVVTPSQ